MSMKTIRIKTKVHSKTEYGNGSWAVNFFGDFECACDENAKVFNTANANLRLDLHSVKPEAAALLTPGKDVFIDILLIDEGEGAE